MPIANPDSYTGTPGQPIYGGRPAPPPNELRVSLPTGSATNYPLQFGRAFGEGAIAGEPQISIAGTPVAQQQADVKTRYSDGSVKFAVLSCIIPSLTTTEIVLTIGNKAAATRTPETVANMLANYNFNAQIDVRQSAVSWAGAPVSARTYLQTLSDATLAANTTNHSPNSRYWTQGPVCTTLILADHTGKSLDFGSTAAKCMRPHWVIEFWPSINRYKVRHIIEIADVTKMRGETGMNVIFSDGNTAPVQRLNQVDVAMKSGTFNSREYWAGAQVPRANVKHGVAYLAAVGVIPNYDPSIQMNQLAIADYATQFSAMPKGLGSAGQYQKSMPTTGGRSDLGVFNKWEIVALYDGSAHMHEYSDFHNECSGMWDIYWREGAARPFFGATDANGRCVTKFSRPTQFTWRLDGTSTAAIDKFTYDGGQIGDRDGWIPDDAHFPSMHYVSYLTTGNVFWYEKMQQVSAWAMFVHDPATVYNELGSGDSPSRMLMWNLQVRGFAWLYRNRARAWWAAVDGSPDKALHQQAMDEATAHRCAAYGINELANHPVYVAWVPNRVAQWGNNISPIPNGMGFLTKNDGFTVSGVGGTWPLNSNERTVAPWMQNFVVAATNHAFELGYAPAKALRDFSARAVLQVVASATPHLYSLYGFPSGKLDNSFYQSIGELLADWPGAPSSTPDWPVSSSSGWNAGGAPNTRGVVTFDYGNHAAFAVASANGDPGQAAAWAVIQPYHQNTFYYNHDPRTAVIPRT